MKSSTFERFPGLRYWDAATVLADIAERPSCDRGTFPRFIVVCDGVSQACKDVRALNRILRCTYSAFPRVFVNAGKGVTIDFDNA